MMRFFDKIKGLKLVAVLAAMATCLVAGAENKIYIEPFNIPDYEPVDVPIYMDNDQPLQAFQFRFDLPEELELVAGSAVANPERIGDGQTVTANGVAVIVFSAYGEQIKGNSGEIMTVKMRVKEGMLSNTDVTLGLSKIRLTAVGATQSTIVADQQTTVTLGEQPEKPRFSMTTTATEAVVTPGQSFPIEVSVENSFDLGGLQFLMTLPEGFTFGKNDIKPSSRMELGTTFTKTVRPNGTISIQVVNMGMVNTTIATAGEGVLFTINVAVPENYTAKTGTIEFNEIIASNTTGFGEVSYDKTVSINVINGASYLSDANEVVAGLRTSLTEALVTIAETCPDVKDNFTGADITTAIDAIETAAAAAAADGTLPGSYDTVVTEPAAAVTASIAKLIEDAQAAQAAFKAEVDRVAANEKAYKAVADEIASLQASLDAMKQKVAETYPGINVEAQVSAAQAAIDKTKAEAEAAFKAVATEGTFNYTVDAEGINALIAAIESAAKLASDEAARVAANEAAYKTVSDEIAALQVKLDAMKQTVAETYPGIKVPAEETAAQAAIDKAQAEAAAAFEAVATEGVFSYTVDAEAIDALIAAIDTAAKAAYDEAARVAANEKAYNASLDEIKRLADKLESMKMLVAVTYPKVNVDKEIAAAQEAIDKAKADAAAAFEAVATEGEYNYTVDTAAIEALIDAIRKAAVDAQAALEAEAARVAANEAAYQAVLNEIAALQGKLDNMKMLVNVSYPTADVTAETAAAQEAIDQAKADAAAALEAVADEGNFDYTVDAKAIEALIDEILVAAKNSGITDIEVETANGVKYFNLQGVRIVNPEKGMMLIRVTPDGKSEKVVL